MKKQKNGSKIELKVRTSVILGLTVVIVFSILLPLILNMLNNHVEIASQSDFGGWLGFLGSYIGGIFSGLCTLGTLFFAFYQLSAERKIANENEKRDQAKKISAWIDSEDLFQIGEPPTF